MSDLDPGDEAVVATGLTKRFGPDLVVDQIDLAIPTGSVTAFAGANGSGKTTTIRMMLGLVQPTAGTVLFHNKPLTDIENPRRVVGAALDRLGAHPGMRARQHLRLVSLSAGLDEGRIGDALAQVGLADAADRRLSTYSTGMLQRLSLATALLGDPPILILDEPARGLDPQGLQWLRDLLCGRAEAGAAVFVSTHQLAELASVVDQVVIIDRGRIAAAGRRDELVDRFGVTNLSDAVLAATS